MLGNVVRFVAKELVASYLLGPVSQYCLDSTFMAKIPSVTVGMVLFSRMLAVRAEDDVPYSDNATAVDEGFTDTDQGVYEAGWDG